MSAKKQPSLAKKQVKRQLAWPVFRFRSTFHCLRFSFAILRARKHLITFLQLSIYFIPYFSFPLLFFVESSCSFLSSSALTHSWLSSLSFHRSFLPSFTHYCLNHSAPVIISQGYTLSDFIKPSTQLHLHISYHRPPFACSRIIPAVFSFLRPHPLRRYLLLVTSSFVQLPPVKLFFPEDFLNSTGSQWFSAVSI